MLNGGGALEAERAFATLYARHRDFVVRVAMRTVNDPEVALDALQETFTYLLTRFPPPGDGLTLTARLTTYLYPIARNAAISQLRKRRAGEPVDPDELAADPAPHDDDVDRLLATLSPERREVLTLRFVEGMQLAEIAEALSVPVGTVKSRLSLAIKALREDPATKTFFER